MIPHPRKPQTKYVFFTSQKRVEAALKAAYEIASVSSKDTPAVAGLILEEDYRQWLKQQSSRKHGSL